MKRNLLATRRLGFVGSLGLILMAIAALSPGSAEAVGLELEGRYWFPSVSGSISFSEFDLVPEIDVTELLGLEADDVLEGRITFRPFLGIFVRAAYQNMSNSGQRSLSGDFLGIPLPIDGEVTSSLDFDYGRLAVGWQFVTPKKTLRIGPFVEAKGVTGDAAAAVRSILITDSISESFEAAFPAVGALLEIQPGEKIQIFAEASFEVGYDEADMMDAEVGVRFYPIHMVGVGGGYRIIDLDGAIDDVRLDVDWDGFFLSAVLRF